MNDYVEKLLSICSNALSPLEGVKDCSEFFSSPLSFELNTLLNRKNGCYGFESALHIFPYQTTHEEIGLVDWNNKNLWISSYEDMAIGALYFAEDVFGGQFCLKTNGIYFFDPETAEFTKFANNINEWCELILSDYSVVTGYSLAHSWQEINGPIPSGYRLAPKIPFVAGGLYELDNLYICKSHELMEAAANIALQIRDTPDGSNVQLVINT
ncbi:SMI1/KNR4 family protein [Pantoea anthophila]|uniref:SMI1/KNR4 family protein n=1 Tax=Pantoea anthophila TaxID=470931 RepID=A0ABY2Z2G0_9GAMM|nr:SMI1/KNR4 family protein [Pantoea anthophila]TPV21325.1 SMI1/KNR4 family protein [Pantoea anthophila]WIM56422.1 SMI1/KNR4 family protein [Pantoea anthophila]